MNTHTTITALIESLLDTWNRKDKAAFCGHFTGEASYLTGEGEWRQGRHAIGELMDEPQSTALVEVDGPVEVRDHGSVVTAIFRWRSQSDVRPAGRGLVTCVLVNQGTSWLIDILQNTDVMRGGPERPAKD
jgi:uncharacterized protein (TIGR02246 family)